jgi:uncharacterized protein with PIN domain
MGLFSKLFRQSRSHASQLEFSMGAPLAHTCAKCGKKLHAGTGAIVMGGMEMVEHMARRAMQCPSCRQVFCSGCSLRADEALGRPKGATDFTCPFCRTSGIA